VRPFDIQVNGYAGADFCSATLALEQCRHACDALAADGVDGILATVITGTSGETLRGSPERDWASSGMTG
jgi:N-acetylglucosamine-6-phosphate deacetylase